MRGGVDFNLSEVLRDDAGVCFGIALSASVIPIQDEGGRPGVVIDLQYSVQWVTGDELIRSRK